MIKLFRQLIAALSGLFFKLIPDLYDIFYDLSRARFFTDDTIRRLAGNIYILVSVVMLFTFSVQLIKAIVNPDTLFDSKKGTGAFVKRCAFAIVMITAVPILFNEMFILQDTIITNNLIEKVVVGYSGDSSQLRIGQYLAASSLEEVLYPEEGVQTSDPMLQTNYDLMLNNDIKTYYDLVVDDISEKDNDIFVLHYEPLVAVLISVFVCYMLVTTCMDMAVRMVKLELLQLIAPISIIAYIIKEKDNSLEKWFSEVAKTYALVFIKIAALIFGVFILQHLPDFFNRNQDFSHPWIIKLLVIIAIFTIINELPNLIQSLFGVEFKFKGGIGGRLGQMAIVGNMAQKAWNAVASPKGIVKSGAAIGSAAGSMISHTVASTRNAIEHGRAEAERLRAAGNPNATVRGVRAGVLRGVGGLLTTGGAGLRGMSNGWKNGNMQSVGNEYNRYMQTHPENSTLGGRIADSITSGLGLGTAQERHDRRARTFEMFIDNNGNYYNEDDGSGNRRAVRLTQEQLDAQRNIYNNIQARRNAVRDAANHALERDGSTIQTTIDGTTGNYHQLVDALNNLRNSGPQRSAYSADAAGETAYRDALRNHQNAINTFETQLRTWHDRTRDQIINDTISNVAGNTNIRNTNDGNIILNSSTVLNQTLRDNPLHDAHGVINNVANTADLDRLNLLVEQQIGQFDTTQQSQQQRNIQEQRGEAGRRRQANDQAYHAAHGGGNNGGNNH